MKPATLVLIILLFLFSGLLGFSLSWYIHRPNPEVPVIETYHYPASFVKQLKGDPLAGKKIFKEFCTTCHGRQPIIDIPAPRIGDQKIWQALDTIGVDNLLKITVTGKGAMPARGGCFECSDDQLRATIVYMLNESSAVSR